MNRFRFRNLVLVLLSTLGLSACLTLEVRTRLSADGSAERTVVIAVDSALLRTVPVDPLDPIRAEAETRGWRVERYQDPAREQVGLRFERALPALEDLNRPAEGDPLGGLEQVALGEAGGFQTLSVTLSLSGILDRLRIAAGEPPLSVEDRTLLQAADFRMRYEIELPGPIVEYSPRDGAQVEGRRIRWAVPLRPDQPSITLYAMWRPTRSIPNCAGSGLSLLAIPAVIAGARLWSQRRLA